MKRETDGTKKEGQTGREKSREMERWRKLEEIGT